MEKGRAWVWCHGGWGMHVLYKPILQVDIGIEGLVIIDDPSAFDEQPVTLGTKQSTKCQ